MNHENKRERERERERATKSLQRDRISRWLATIFHYYVSPAISFSLSRREFYLSLYTSISLHGLVYTHMYVYTLKIIPRKFSSTTATLAAWLSNSARLSRPTRSSPCSWSLILPLTRVYVHTARFFCSLALSSVRALNVRVRKAHGLIHQCCATSAADTAEFSRPIGCAMNTSGTRDRERTLLSLSLCVFALFAASYTALSSCTPRARRLNIILRGEFVPLWYRLMAVPLYWLSCHRGSVLTTLCWRNYYYFNSMSISSQIYSERTHNWVFIDWNVISQLAGIPNITLPMYSFKVVNKIITNNDSAISALHTCKTIESTFFSLGMFASARYAS